MISTDDLEYPREYRSLGGGGRRFSNVGLVHTSEHRHTVMAAQSLEALSNLHKVDMERKRDAFMEHLKNKYHQQQQQQQHQHQQQQPHSLPPSPSPSHSSMRERPQERSAREQDQSYLFSTSVRTLKAHVCKVDEMTISIYANRLAKLTGEGFGLGVRCVCTCVRTAESHTHAHARARLRAHTPTSKQQQPNYWSFKSRSPRHSQSTQSGLADQASKLSYASAEHLETMSEADLPLGFSRSSRLRQSLPLSRSASQSKLRSPGVLFLQFGDETRRVHITHELTSMETLHALIVHMFPQKLTAGMLKSPNTAILIKDEARNVFYELEDVRDIQDRSIIKIFRKEPIYASYPASHLANGDLRREMVYTSRESSPTRRLNTLPSSSSASPPSSSPARSRLSYSGTTGRPPSFPPHPHAGGGHHGGHPHGGHHHGPQSANAAPVGLSHSPSAILERRDVKPDEEVSAKSLVLLKNEGLYADPYSLVHEGRLSIASTQSLAALSGPLDPLGPTGLYRRGSMRSLSTYSAAGLQGEMDDPLYRPGAGIYTDTYATLGFRLPPSSPQKMASDVPAMRDVSRDVFSSPPSRASPVRQSFRKDSSSSVFVESPKSRPSSSSEPLSLQSANSPLAGNEETRDRMEAMEKQIASLTGLVQSVLTRGPDSDTAHFLLCGLLRLCMMAGCPPDQGVEFSRPFPFSSSEKTESASDGSATGNQTPSAPLALMPPPPSGGSPASTVSKLQMQLNLHDLKQNATDLRKQLSHLRKMQLQNQDSMRTLMKRTEGEITMRVCDALRKQEDPLQRQRLLVEEERLKYLNEEELIIQQLHDLEKSVDEIQKDSSTNHKQVPMQELEEKAAVLRRLGETLTELKNQFPGLQSKMRVVLRVEVEAVKFLKEEPHRLDALLKRCRTITDTLTALRRQATEGVWKSQEDGMAEDYRKSVDFDLATSPPLSISDNLSNWSPHTSSPHGHAHSHAHSHAHNHGHGSHPSPGQKERDPLKEHGGRQGPDKSLSMEVRLAAERDWEEKRASLTQYSAQDINRLLEETQAELMKAIPDLDFAAKQMKPQQSLSQTRPDQSSQNSQPANAATGAGITNATPEHRPPKPQHSSHKISREGGSRRGSDELTVARYRMEKHSKSPPPPPPRRSFPSSPGPTSRSGEPITSEKSLKKCESEDCDMPKPMVKLRKSLSEVPRPASTPPTTGAQREGADDERNHADMEVPRIVLTECQSGAPPNGAHHQAAPPYTVTVSTGSRFKRGGPHRHSVTGAETLSWRQLLITDGREPQRKPGAEGSAGSAAPAPKSLPEGQQGQPARARAPGDDIRSRTYRRLDSLEETIRELENSLMEIGAHPSSEPLSPVTPPAEGAPSDSAAAAQQPDQTPTESAGSGGTKRPPVPPKPSIRPPYVQGGNSSSSGGGKALHSSSSAALRLKHLQQSNPEKSKLSKQREEFLKSQGQLQALGGSFLTDPLLTGTRAASFSGRLPSSGGSGPTVALFAPGLRKYPQDGSGSSGGGGDLPSFSASSSQARALLASLGAEALLLSSTLRQHRLLHPTATAQTNGRSASSPSPTTSPTSVGHSLKYPMASLGGQKEGRSKTLPKATSSGAE
ncbi:SRC kinase signaling inhibitor 1 [Sardina pilchardus]|uniref:SRC kinase signaling inhibitor 1 n=1 Tax=Sardina pilchardus TaxID=27697 RepID=UPI002E113890